MFVKAYPWGKLEPGQCLSLGDCIVNYGKYLP